jgi:L,D-transpeptidase YcbB
MHRTNIRAIFIFLIFCVQHALTMDVYAQGLLYPVLVNKFYATTHQPLFWLNSAASSKEMRVLLLQKLESSAYIGTDRSRYSYGKLLESKLEQTGDSATLKKLDIRYTDAAIAYCKDLYQGYGVNTWIKYDEWSTKYADRDNDFIIGHLSTIKSSAELNGFINSLEPVSKEYAAYKSELVAQYINKNIIKAKQVAASLNCYRWIHHFNFEKLIVVNAASATLNYYENNREILFSKMIVGKPSRRTPRFDATCKQIILYPYWNVPTDIALKELVPKYKRYPSLVDQQRIQILDAKGNIVNPHSINWSRYSKNYFPYRLRQSTGCDNSLGIIKFDLTSPFGVYLHDTNEKGLFKSNNRHRSHGCMRVEKAIELGNYLLNNKLDTTFLQACFKGEEPRAIQLEKPVPVFVVYLTAALADNIVVNYYRDVYHLNY